jgi:uncharacterized membrane protein
MGQAGDQDDPWGLDEPVHWQPAPSRRARHAGRTTRAGGGAGAGRVHALLLALLAPVVAATVAGIVLLWPRGELPPIAEGLGGPPVQLDATVVESRSQPCAGTTVADGIFCQQVTADLTSGAQDGQRVRFQIPKDRDVPTLVPGDPVVLGFVAESAPGEQYVLLDYQRDTPMLVLAGVFVLVLLVFGRLKGLRALAGLAATLAVVLGFVLPAILDGANPVVVVLVGGSAAAILALYVTLGLHVRTTVALLGTLASLALVGVLAWLFVETTRFTGLASEDAVLLRLGAAEVNPQGLLLAGIVLGTLGVLDDVTVTQASAVWQLRRANPGWGVGALYRSAITVGRDHIASTVNTLVLAYAGASLPLLLLLRQASRPVATVLTGELVAIEVVRTLVGSIGLMASVPLTTLIAALVAAGTDPGAAGFGFASRSPDADAGHPHAH